MTASASPPDPRRLDVLRLAAAGGVLDGSWPQAGFVRLLEGSLPLDDGAPPAVVHFHAQGELRRPRAAAPQSWLRLGARTTVRLACQRCLQPLAWPLEVERQIRFVQDEAEAERLDEESEDDVLAAPRRLDLATLVEDELILALPLVPRHEGDCPQPLPVPLSEPPPAAAAPVARPDNPFAVLGALRTGAPAEPD